MDAILFHPKLVHLPMALGVLMPFVGAGLLLAWWRNWFPRRIWLVALVLQAVLVVSTLAGLQTGESDEERVERFVPERYLEEHEVAAQSFAWASAAVLAVMVLVTALPERRLALTLAAVATAGSAGVLWLGYRTGEAGGRLVYEHGAAQAYTLGTQGSRAPPASRTTHDDDDD